ncbi:MAG: ATP-binding cassette domain-containing protein [Acetobacteraceae bacterium]|nr:ATP-binding cassette domain-containing protein [Acetobacteraceae bacterium]
MTMPNIDTLTRPASITGVPQQHTITLRRPVRAGHGMAVRLQGVVKRYGSRDVLRELDLDIAPGSFVAIVGRSGGGKSTLLRLIAGLEMADEGIVSVDGAPLAGLAPHTTVMFQDPRLLPWQRVVSNVGIARRPDWRRHALEALRDVGLEDRAQEWPAVLSGGQKQRVALARALVSHPRLLLLDEPLGALDALTRGEMQRLIGSIWVGQGFTAVLVTHDVSEAVALSDRVVVLRDGAIALDQAVALPARGRGQPPRWRPLRRRSWTNC